MPKVSIKIDGTEELVRKLSLFPSKIRRATIESLRVGGELVKNDARRDAPRGKTRKLSENIDVELDEKDMTMDVGLNKEVWYGIFAEVGTPHHGAQPFLRPALDNNENTIKQVFIRKLERHIRRLLDGSR